LSAEERRYLDDVGHLGGRLYLAYIMNISQDRQPQLIPNFSKNLESFIDTGPTVCTYRSAISLVIRSLKDVRDSTATSNLSNGSSHFECVPFALDDTRPSNQEQFAIAELDISNMKGLDLGPHKEKIFYTSAAANWKEEGQTGHAFNLQGEKSSPTD
jgi:hypothetical protein